MGKNNFIAEERQQLERQDIPYFFRFAGEKTLRLFTDSSWNFKDVADQENYPETYQIAAPTLRAEDVGLDLIGNFKERTLQGFMQIVTYFVRVRELSELKLQDSVCDVKVKNKTVQLKHSTLGFFEWKL